MYEPIGLVLSGRCPTNMPLVDASGIPAPMSGFMPRMRRRLTVGLFANKPMRVMANAVLDEYSISRWRPAERPLNTRFRVELYRSQKPLIGNAIRCLLRDGSVPVSPPTHVMRVTPSFLPARCPMGIPIAAFYGTCFESISHSMILQ
nr:hypothetical protein [Xaviernesmea oryzae]